MSQYQVLAPPVLLWCALLCRAPGSLWAVAVVAMELQITLLSSSPLMDFSDSKQKLECVVTYILQINVSLHTCVDTLSWDICSRSKKAALSLWYVMKALSCSFLLITSSRLFFPLQDCIQLNQYKLKSEIGKVGLSVFYHLFICRAFWNISSIFERMEPVKWLFSACPHKKLSLFYCLHILTFYVGSPIHY